MKTILVTGAKGQLAQTIGELYSRKKEFNFKFVSKEDLDITQENDVNCLFTSGNFDYCINCAAYTNVEQAELDTEQAYNVNAQAVKHLATACKKHNTVLIHISTDYVFDGNKTTPYKETDLTNPINIYGRSKLLGEQYIEEILKEHVTIRTSWLYSIYGNNFVKTIINKINSQSPLKITTTQTGTPTSCIDLAEFIFKIIQQKETPYGLYHFSASNEATWYSFATQIASSFEGYELSNITPVGDFPTKAKRPKYSVLDNSKSQKLNDKKIDWKNSVDKVVSYLKCDI